MGMGRKYDIIDVMAAIGLVATLTGSLFVVAAANGFWQQPIPTAIVGTTVSGLEAGLQWLQPALGQAILDDQLLERSDGRMLSNSMRELNRVLEAQQRVDPAPMTLLSRVENRASAMESAHAARAQWVMGRSIVNATKRGVQAGLLSADRYASEFNAQIIRTAEGTGRRLDAAFESFHQANLGRAIVETAVDEQERDAQSQERIGNAIVRVAMAENAYEEARGANQYQLGTAAMAAVRANKLARAMEARTAGDVTAFSEPRTWPEIPAGYFVAAFAGLVGVFFGGLSLVGRKTEADVLSVQSVETLQRVYRIAG